MKVDISREHTFVVCAYKESQYLEECIQSVLNQNIKSNVIISTGCLLYTSDAADEL